MKFPKKYIKRGRFKLHSGQYSSILYDVNAMLTDLKYWRRIIGKLDWLITEIDTTVGIATGGAIIANSFNTYFAMIKDEELKGKVIGEYILIDDVCTTENSLNEAIKIIGRLPKSIFVVVDRRKKEILNIESMYKIK